MKNNTKGFIVPLLIVIALIGIGVGVYLYAKQGKSEQVSTLTTYTNKVYGFGFRYPVEGYLLNEPEESGWGNFKTIATVYQYPAPIEFGANFEVSTKDFTVSGELPIYIESLKGKYFISAEPVVINGITWTKVRMIDDYFEKERAAQYFTEQNGIIYRVYYAPLDSATSDPGRQKDFEAMLASLTFMVPESTAVPEPTTSDVNPQLLKAGTSVLVALRDADYQKLEELTSSAGLSWNEVPNLDLKKSDVAKAAVSDISTDKTEYFFGYTDGRGDPIMLTNAAYAKKYMYTHDYLNAPEVKVNEVVGTGNSLNGILGDAGDRLVIAYHFDGFNPQYGGMDWTTLYLVFDIENGEYKLRGIAKDNWTI